MRNCRVEALQTYERAVRMISTLLYGFFYSFFLFFSFLSFFSPLSYLALRPHRSCDMGEETARQARVKAVPTKLKLRSSGGTTVWTARNSWYSCSKSSWKPDR